MKSRALRPALAAALWFVLVLVPGMFHPGEVLALSALEELTVPAVVKVEGSRVSLLDLCAPGRIPQDWQAVLAGIDLGEAPQMGREKRIQPDQLRAYLRHLIESHGIDPDRVRLDLPDQITVTREGERVSAAQVEEIYRQYILANSRWKTEDLNIHSIRCTDYPVLPKGTMSYEVAASPYEHLLGPVALTIHFSVDGQRVASSHVTGRVDLDQDVVQTVRAMKRNEVLSAEDLQVVRVSVVDHPERFLTDRDQAVGKRLLTGVGANQPLNPRALGEAFVLKRGDKVTVVYQQDGLKLTARGQVKEDASEGGQVKVTNVDSHQTLTCQVIDSQTVEVVP